MELQEAIERRRMVRAFVAAPIESPVLDRLVGNALRAPSAGNSQGTELVVLDDPADTARYWAASLPEPRRSTFGWPGLLEAPVLVLVVVDPQRYLDRYGEPDKAATGLGRTPEAWPVPYWWVDGGMAAHALLLSAVDAGLGALFFGTFGQEGPVRAALGIPDRFRVVGTVAIGHPAPDRAGRSADRPRRPRDEVVHRGRFGG